MPYDLSEVRNMRVSIGQMAAMSGVTIRALRHYDAIGLLKPCEISETGYRYYGEKEALRLQQILLLRALDFPLKEIGRVLDAPAYDEREALARQSELLLLRRERIDKMLSLINQKLKGDQTMAFDAFETTKEENLRAQYAREARERWGETAAYREYEKNMQNRPPEKQAAIDPAAEEIFRGFADLCRRSVPPASAEAARQTTLWQRFITEHYYACTDELLLSLANMYTSDERFTAYLDRFGAGTAAYMSAAIRAAKSGG